MDIGVNEPFKGFIQQECEKFTVQNVDNRKVGIEDDVFWIESGWKMVKVEIINRTWAEIGIEILTADVSYEFSGAVISKF
jgi:hypothetical protein